MSKKTPGKPFLSDIAELRRRARMHIKKGAVTEGYKADRETVVRVLNEALATEIVCVLRYKRHQFMAAGINAQAVADEFAGLPTGFLSAASPRRRDALADRRRVVDERDLAET